MASQDPKHGYVRFYLTVLSQLKEAIAVLQKSASETQETIRPYESLVRSAEDPDAREALGPKLEALGTTGLWRPHDAVNLTGLVDVYEVVGRFTFQGEDNSNLLRVQGIVRGLQDELARQQRSLLALKQVPAKLTRRAEGLSQQELASLEAARAEKLRAFEPVARQLREQCAKVLEAVRIVPRPDLSKPETAEQFYVEFVRRMATLYTAALPYLRRALQELCTVAGVELPPSWPDALPFAQSLPPELLTPPPADTPAILELRAQVEQCELQEAQAARALEENTLEARRLEGEKLEHLRRDTDAMEQVNAAKTMLTWANKWDELDGLKAQLEALLQQKQQRVSVVGELYVQHRQLQSTAQTLQAELQDLQNRFQANAEALAAHKKDEPAIFGKDEWRQKLAELEARRAELTQLLAQKQALLTRTVAELTTVQARAQTEQQQVGLAEQSLEEQKLRVQQAMETILSLEQSLGSHKPPRRLTSPQVEEHFQAVWNARNEIKSRADRLGEQLRRTADDAERLKTQLRQWTQEKQRVQGQLERAQSEAVVAQKEAMAQLSQRRKTGFLQYVAQVLGPFEESLVNVDRIFIDPAKDLMLQRTEGAPVQAEGLRTQADGLAQGLQQLAPRLQAQWDAQSSVLRRVQNDFCDKVLDAVKDAWIA